jgi:hypothetical protein
MTAKKESLLPTKESKEMTDKIHRLIRRFSQELVTLVSQEIGARAVYVKRKGGPPKGVPAPQRECPLCLGNVNGRRYRNYVCFECRPKNWKYKKDPRKDKWGAGYKVEIPLYEAPGLKPKSVEVPDAEPDFLDSIALVVPEVKPDRPASKLVTQDVGSDEDFFG